MKATCDCCGLGAKHHEVRRVRVIGRHGEGDQVIELPLCHGCRTRSNRTWRRRWMPVAAP